MAPGDPARPRSLVSATHDVGVKRLYFAVQVDVEDALQRGGNQRLLVLSDRVEMPWNSKNQNRDHLSLKSYTLVSGRGRIS